jgi:hypothetical protein
MPVLSVARTAVCLAASHILYRRSYILYRPSAGRTRYNSCAVSRDAAHAVVLTAVGMLCGVGATAAMRVR